MILGYKDGYDVISEVPGVAEAYKIFAANSTVMQKTLPMTTIRCLIREATSTAIKVSVVSENLFIKDKKVCSKEEELGYIRYEDGKIEISPENFLEAALGGRSINDMQNLLIPVAAYISTAKPYLYKAFIDFGRPDCRWSFIQNIISIIQLGREDELEKAMKTSPVLIRNNIDSKNLLDVMDEIKGTSIPAKCKEWLNSIDSYRLQASATSLFSLIVKKENGNNAIIVKDFFTNCYKYLIDKREWNWESNFETFCECAKELISAGYNSKSMLEYLLRQCFYFSDEFMFPVKEIKILKDYMNICKQMGSDWERYPTCLQKSHNIAATNFNSLSSVDEAVERDFMAAVSIYGKKYSMEMEDKKTKEKWILMAPKAPQDVINEGINLNHCVSSYVRLIANGVSQIMFLRKADAPEESLYTVEIINNKVTEAKGAYNEDLPEEAENILRKMEKTW